jgi:hypothetical protein
MQQEINETLVQELRRMLLDGATPSRLLQRLLEDPSMQGILAPGVIDRYFCAAFGSKVYPILAAQGDVFSSLQFAYLNGDVLHKMLEDLSQWRSSVEGVNNAWCEDVQAVDSQVKLEEFDAKKDPYLTGSWDRLDAKAQSYIRHCMSALSVAQEQVHILRMLAERLQQKAFWLEQQAKKPVRPDNCNPE